MIAISIAASAQKKDSVAMAKDSLALDSVILRGQGYVYASINTYITQHFQNLTIKEVNDLMTTMQQLFGDERKYFQQTLKKK